MITLHDNIDPKEEPTREAIGSWIKKTSIRGRNRLLGDECVLFSYRNDGAAFRISLYLSDFDKINLRVRSRKKKPPANFQETLDNISQLLKAEQAIPLETQVHDVLPDIMTLEKPCFIKISGQDFPLYFANIDFQVYEPQYTAVSSVSNTLDFSSAQGVKERHLNCVPVKPGFYALKRAIQIVCEQLQVPNGVMQNMLEAVHQVNANILNFMVDVIESINENPTMIRDLIRAHIADTKDFSYMVRIIERMILGNQFDTAFFLSQFFGKNDPDFLKVQGLAENALLAVPYTKDKSDEYFCNLVKIRFNIALATRDASDALLLLKALNELSGGTGFMDEKQSDDLLSLASIISQAHMTIRDAKSAATKSVVTTTANTATSPILFNQQLPTRMQSSFSSPFLRSSEAKLGDWIRKTMISADNPILSHESLHVSYTLPQLLARVTIFLIDYDDIRIEIREGEQIKIFPHEEISQHHLPQAINADILGAIEKLKLNTTAVMHDLIDTLNSDTEGTLEVIKKLCSDATSTSYLLRIIVRMIKEEQILAAFYLRRAFDRSGPEFTLATYYVQQAIQRHSTPVNMPQNELPARYSPLILSNSAYSLINSNTQASLQSDTSHGEQLPVYSPLILSNSDYSLINSNTQASFNSDASHGAVMNEPHLKQRRHTI